MAKDETDIAMINFEKEATDEEVGDIVNEIRAMHNLLVRTDGHNGRYKVSRVEEEDE